MVKSKTLAGALLVAIISLVAGYALGQFFAPAGETVTTTSSTTITEIQTITITSTWKITETVTSTTAVVRDLPIPSPANSTAIIRGHFILNGSVFVMLSIDKPTYVLGDIVHIKGTITNLTPINFSLGFGYFNIWSSMITIWDDKGGIIWVSPEWYRLGGIGPPPADTFDLKAEETIIFDWATRDWNMTGLHIIPRQPNESSGRVAYNDFLVPEGQYYLIYQPEYSYIVNNSWQRESFDVTIPFTITKQD